MGRKEAGESQETVADWEPGAWLRILGVMPVIRGRGAQWSSLYPAYSSPV